MVERHRQEEYGEKESGGEGEGRKKRKEMSRGRTKMIPDIVAHILILSYAIRKRL
jgi:hypothetical protein